SVNVIPGKENVTLNIRNPDGKVITNADGVKSGKITASSDGEYMIDAISKNPADFTLSVGVKNP
ncbi:MAG TPA: hypothetical protein DEP38_07450, partial [Cyanobacteria bacterium UBA9226]|nr:hypothetical protein [Cyanobacteria bacterium UBA9226]